MQFVEKQHNLTLQALILYKSLIYSNIFSEDISSTTIQKRYTLENIVIFIDTNYEFVLIRIHNI